MFSFLLLILSCHHSRRTSALQDRVSHLLDHDDFPERVLISRWDHLRLIPHGKIYHTTNESLPNPTEFTAVQTPDGIRVLLPIGCDAFVVFALIEHLDRTITRRTLIYPSITKEYVHASLMLAPGAPISVKRCTQSWCEILLDRGYIGSDTPYETKDGRIKIKGWVARSDVGLIYRPQDFISPAQELCYSLPRNTMLFDRADEAPIGHFVDHDIWNGKLNGSSFSFTQNRLKGTGLLQTQEITSKPCPSRTAVGGGCSWGVSHGAFLYLHRGDPIFDRPNGVQVGMVTHDTKVLYHKEYSGWYNISVPTHWEGLSFWIPARD